MRPVSIDINVLKHAEGSCMICWGDTRVICSATVETRMPMFRRNTGLGWVTAEYSMLPRATTSRSIRESKSGRPSGRSQEIQRLIGRSLRAAVDFVALGERTIIIDCDVIQADGGTRCASVTGGWVALRLAIDKLLRSRKIRIDPLPDHVAAVSCGLYSGQGVLDMDYAEDSEASADANFVMTGIGGLIEVQCSAEETPFSEEEMDKLLRLARQGVSELVDIQAAAAARA